MYDGWRQYYVEVSNAQGHVYGSLASSSPTLHQSTPTQPLFLAHEEDTRDTEEDSVEHEADEHARITKNEHANDEEEQQHMRGEAQFHGGVPSFP